ncbi:hypothetical protein [Arabidopsis thaliana]|uniref:Uncharacterized protein AT4g25180 n=1 Tax=Arabidopsis thaliana TaxID=3702 RepID=Q9SB44_ARATH|nr:hypothetical protein [Arabidopsis thaliana]CAB79427.1 hypothetical protein [Arabidopsis thaliana]
MSSSPEVAFQPSLSPLAIRSFGVPKEDDKPNSDVNPSSPASILPAVSSVTAAQEDGEEVHNFVTRTGDDYVEPWDYRNSYYPTVLPLRKPNSGDIELLDQEEFGEVAKNRDYDENTINSAEELGLTSVQHSKKQMFIFKIPDCLPVVKQTTGATTKRSVREYSSGISNPFEGLPEGFMGKMLVYKSGAVKLKVGDALFDVSHFRLIIIICEPTYLKLCWNSPPLVSPGPGTKIPNDVVAIDIKGRNCSRIGSSAKFVTVTPDVESLLNPASDMETQK